MIHTSLSTYSGPEFLLFYAVAMVAAVIAGVWLPRFLRAQGGARPVTDRLELAWLAGRSGRVTEAVLARLLGSGALEPAGSNKLRVALRERGSDRADQAILGLPGGFGITEAHKSLKPMIDEVEGRLERDGLLLSSGERRSLRFVSVLPYFAVLALGWYRRQAGLAEGMPVGFLTLMMFLTGFMAIFRFAVLDPRSRSWQPAVGAARQRSRPPRSAPTPPHTGLGVALFGTVILAGTPFAELHAMRRAAGSDGAGGFSSDSGGDSGGSDGGGCGGGGCGGRGGEAAQAVGPPNASPGKSRGGAAKFACDSATAIGPRDSRTFVLHLPTPPRPPRPRTGRAAPDAAPPSRRRYPRAPPRRALRRSTIRPTGPSPRAPGGESRGWAGRTLRGGPPVPA